MQTIKKEANKNLRLATEADIDNKGKRVFYFKTHNDTLQIRRMLPEDYTNFKQIKKKEYIDEFKESCRKDWADKTEMLWKYLFEERLYIKRNESN